MISRLQIVLFASILALLAWASPAFAQNQPFTYQGKLDQSGTPATGPIDLVVRLFPTETDGTAIGTQTINGVPLIGGVFTVTLNANGEFTANPFATGAPRWVEITVNGQTITPRQRLTVSPMAAFSAAPWVLSGTSVSYTKGNVGIGTTTPDRPLTVNQASVAGGTVRSAQSISLQADGATFWHMNLLAPSGPNSGLFGLNFAESGVADFRLFLEKGGNVGIGTRDPAKTLDVRGDIAFGSAGQFSPVASDSGETRMVFGVVNGDDGSFFSGSGFTVSRLGVGSYRVTFTTAFGGIPAVTITPVVAGVAIHSSTNALSAVGVNVDIFNAAGNRTDEHFSIIVIGRR